MRRSLLIVAALALPAHADMVPDPYRRVNACYRIENPQVGRFIIVATAAWEDGERDWRALKPDGCLPLTNGGGTLVAAVDAARWGERASDAPDVELASASASVSLSLGFMVPHESEHRERIVLYRVASADEQRVVLHKHRVTDVFKGGRESVKEFSRP